MSTDYKFTIRRKSDDKKIASFYYNAIKNISDCYLPSDIDISFDPNTFSNKTVLYLEQIESDRAKLKFAKLRFENMMAEKKDLIAKAVSLDIKSALEDDIFELQANIDDIIYADEALVGLVAVVRCLTEDLIVNSNDDESSVAYKANAVDLGNDKYVFTADVKLEVEVSY